MLTFFLLKIYFNGKGLDDKLNPNFLFFFCLENNSLFSFHEMTIFVSISISFFNSQNGKARFYLFLGVRKYSTLYAYVYCVQIEPF